MDANVGRSRVQASSLLITVIIALVIGLSCSLLILLAYHSLRVRTDLRIEEKLNRNVRSSINLVLEDDLSGGEMSRRTIDLFGQGDDSVGIREEEWGVYDIASVEAMAGGRTRRKNFFFGALLPDSLDGCLYLAEHQRSLSLVGDTRLIGKAHLPKAGVKPAYVDQRGYSNTELVTGATVLSKDSLFPIRSALLQHFVDLAREDSSRKGGDPLPDSLDRSFADSLTVLRGKGELILTGTQLNGHILVLSDSIIRVRAGARLNNVILSAPVVWLEAGFSGRVQAFCSDSLRVEANCNLLYPSALVLVKKAGDKNQPRLMIAGDCHLEGLVLTSCPPGDLFKTYLEIGQHSTVRGVVYTGGYLCLKGAVEGITVTDYFIYRTSAVIYENYLVDAVLDRSRLSTWFTGPVIFNSSRHNRVIQWVN